MALDVVQPSLVQERPHNRGRRQCSCCPYGYHIDLDFVRYCESITNAQLMPSMSVKRSKWNNVRKKRASREALLGLVRTQSPEPVKAETPAVLSSYMGDDLQRAVLDFEKTLKYASLPRISSNKDWNGFDSLELNNHEIHPKNHGNHTSQTFPRNFGGSGRDGTHLVSPLQIEEMLFSGAISNNNIREQMAASLRRMKELEEQNKQIPRLNDKIVLLSEENVKLTKELRSMEILQSDTGQVGVLRKENDLLKNKIKRMESQMIDKEQLEFLREENKSLRMKTQQDEYQELNPGLPVIALDKFTSTSDLVHCRAAAVGCTVLTREVGVSPSVTVTRTIGIATEPKPEPRLSQVSVDFVSLNKIIGKTLPTNSKTVGVNTEHISEPKMPIKPCPEVKTVTSSTDLKMSEIVTRSELNSRLEHMNVKTAAPQKSSIRVNTHLLHDQIFTQNDLDERVARFAKTYETNFLSTNLPKKPSMANTYVQTVYKTERKSVALQIRPKMSDAGITAKCSKSTQGVQALVHTKEIGVSEDTTIPEVCEKCRVSRASVGTLFPDKSEQLLLRINSSSEMTVPNRNTRSRSTDTRELSITRDAAMNTSKTLERINSDPELSYTKKNTRTRSTDTQQLRYSKDAAINTAKKELIAKAVGTGDYSCNKCSSQKTNHHVTSDMHLSAAALHKPLPAKRPSYLPVSISRVKPQSTTSPLQQPLQHEGSNSDSGSDDGTYTIHQDVGASAKDDPFQDLSPKPRNYEGASQREPSKEMRGAMKVLNDALIKSPVGDIPKHVKTAVNIVQQEWFKVSSVASANPLVVEYYLDCFEEISGTLLEYVVNMTDVSGNTAMHYAVSNGNFDVVSILLDSKVCNINKLNTAGYTCIMLVALTKVKSETDREVVRRLFHMADVNIRAKEHGQTALMLAVSHGRIDTVELLLEAGADINIQDEDGSTALMCAAEHGYIDIVKLLLAQPDCDLSITDNDGTTALAIAMEAGNRDIGVLLYAQEHFSRGSSPYTSLKHKRAKSTTPTLKGSRPSTPSHSSHRRDSDVLEA